MPILKMTTGLCGPHFSLARGDEHEFDEDEASRLIRAGFAVATDGFVPVDPDAEVDKAADEAAANAAEADQALNEAEASGEAADVSQATVEEKAAAAVPATPKKRGKA